MWGRCPLHPPGYLDQEECGTGRLSWHTLRYFWTVEGARSLGFPCDGKGEQEGQRCYRDKAKAKGNAKEPVDLNGEEKEQGDDDEDGGTLFQPVPRGPGGGEEGESGQPFQRVDEDGEINVVVGLAREDRSVGGQNDGDGRSGLVSAGGVSHCRPGLTPL